jgi:hypothetical protein
VPFYQLAFIELRGIPSARYQDENAAVAEASCAGTSRRAGR